MWSQIKNEYNQMDLITYFWIHSSCPPRDLKRFLAVKQQKKASFSQAFRFNLSFFNAERKSSILQMD